MQSKRQTEPRLLIGWKKLDETMETEYLSLATDIRNKMKQCIRYTNQRTRLQLHNCASIKEKNCLITSLRAEANQEHIRLIQVKEMCFHTLLQWFSGGSRFIEALEKLFSFQSYTPLLLTYLFDLKTSEINLQLARLLDAYSLCADFRKRTKMLAVKSAVSLESELTSLSDLVQIPELEVLFRKNKSGEQKTGRQICSYKLLKLKAHLFPITEHRPLSEQLYDYQYEVFCTELDYLSLAESSHALKKQDESISLLHTALRMQPSDPSLNFVFPLETESANFIKASILASYQLLGQDSREQIEAALEAELWYRREHKIEVDCVRLGVSVATAFKQLGDAYLLTGGDKIKAIACFQKANIAAGRFCSNFYVLAQARKLLMGTVRNPTSEFSSRDLDIVSVLTDYYTTLGATSTALDYLQTEVSGMKNCTGSKRLAECARKLGQDSLALGLYAKALEACTEKSELSEVYIHLGQSCDKNHLREEALSHYQSALQLIEDSEKCNLRELHWTIGELKVKLHKTRSAKQSFESALNCKFPKPKSAFRTSHVVSRNLCMYDDMGNVFTDVLREDCYCCSSYVLIAEMCSQHRQYLKAKLYYKLVAEAYERQAITSVNSAFAWKRLADCCLFCLGDLETSNNYYQKAIDVLKQNSCKCEGCWTVDFFYDSEIEDVVDRCRSLKQAEVYMSLGNCYVKNSLPEEAKVSYWRFIEVLQTLNSDWVTLAAAYRTLAACYSGPECSALYAHINALDPAKRYKKLAKEWFKRGLYSEGLKELNRGRYATLTRADQFTNCLWQTACKMQQYDRAEEAAIIGLRYTRCRLRNHEIRRLYQTKQIRGCHVMDDSASDDDLFRDSDRLSGED